MDNTLTLADAGSLAAILHAAQRKSVVGRLAPDGQPALIGTARYIGCVWSLAGGRPDYAAEAGTDVLDMNLYVQSGSGTTWIWPVRQLIAESRTDAFIPDFDVAAFEAAGGQAAVPASVAAWKTSQPVRPPCQPDNADLRNWPAEDLLRLARAAGQLWHSTGGSDPHDVLNDRQRTLFDRAAASYLTAGTPDGRSGLSPAHPDPHAGKPLFAAELATAAATRHPDSTATAPLGSQPFKRGDVVEYDLATDSQQVTAIFASYPDNNPEAVYAHVVPLGTRVRVQIRQSCLRHAGPALISAARSWAADCQWEDINYEEDTAGLSDGQVVHGVNEHYAGGWEQFVRDGSETRSGWLFPLVGTSPAPGEMPLPGAGSTRSRDRSQ